MNNRQPIAINYSDLLPLSDQLSNLTANALDVILETPGGSGETVEDMVKLLRSKFATIGVIVPGTAKSAGTIFAMAADEIVMDSMSYSDQLMRRLFGRAKCFRHTRCWRA